MKPERTLLKYFLIYAMLVISWLLSSFAWNLSSTQTTQNSTAGQLINVAAFAAVSMLYWFVMLQRHYQEKNANKPMLQWV